ncbi:MAG: hypothetical protein H7301_02825 [Cryobacterium sp.]|nr:hypothetical protein [Oligoflexia bacterium]
MKLNISAASPTTFERIRPSEAGGDAPKRESKNSFSSQDEQKEAEETPEEKAERLAAAVSDFGSALPSEASDLKAEVQGAGPGLRVTLKDGRGALIRQFTGEEFLRLREAATGTNRGSLLDKKL